MRKNVYFGATRWFYSKPFILSSVSFMFGWLHFSLINGLNAEMLCVFVRHLVITDQLTF